MRLILIAAQSLDGFITRHDTPGSDFASDADREFFRKSLREFDCCVMGSGAYLVARDAIRTACMPERLRVVVSRTPERFATDTIPGKLEFSSAAPAKIVTDLRARGLENCAILGGAQIHSLFLEARLVDELWLTVEPLLFGGGTPLLARPTDIRLEMITSERLSADTLLIKYRVAK